MKSRFSVLLLAYLLLPLLASSQDNPWKMGILPIQWSNVSKSDTESITGLSLTEGNEKKCSVGFRELLLADYIIFGALSKSTEGMCQLEAGIVDVVQEGAIKSQKVATDSLLQIADLADTLALIHTEAAEPKSEPIAESGKGATGRQQDEQRLEELRAKKKSLEEEVQKVRVIRNQQSVWGWISLGVGVGAGILAGCSWYAGDLAYANYQAATITAEVLRYKGEVKRWDAMLCACSGVGVVGLGMSVLFWLTSPRVDPGIAEAIVKVELDIRTLERSLQ